MAKGLHYGGEERTVRGQARAARACCHLAAIVGRVACARTAQLAAGARAARRADSRKARALVRLAAGGTPSRPPSARRARPRATRHGAPPAPSCTSWRTSRAAPWMPPSSLPCWSCAYPTPPTSGATFTRWGCGWWWEWVGGEGGARRPGAGSALEKPGEEGSVCCPSYSFRLCAEKARGLAAASGPHPHKHTSHHHRRHQPNPTQPRRSRRGRRSPCWSSW